MDIYYLQDEWLNGPLAAEELRSRVDSGMLDEKTPMWTPSEEEWMTLAKLLLVTDDTAKVSLNPPSKEARTAPPEWSVLPVPRNLMALRLARDQELITHAQAHRLRNVLFRSEKKRVDLLSSLAMKGWITSSQHATLATALSGDAMPQILGGYEILGELGSGGMGTTYLAKQIAMDRLVALKVLKPRFSQDPDYIRRFEREAKMAARLSHENVATAYEVGEVGGKHFFSMEYVDGQTVCELLEEKGPPPENEATYVIVQVCRALAHAHEHDLVHRDVKPDNIIVKPNGQVKLIDMGLTRSTSSENSNLTETGFVVCTPDYASPEQGLGKREIDIRSDIYSLGCVFFEVLTGEKPFTGSTSMEIIGKHINEPLPPVKKLRPELSDCVCRVVERMVAKRPEDRHQVPGDVMAELSSGTGWAAVPLSSRAGVRPMAEQLESWEKGGWIELCLLPDWREYVHLIGLSLDERLEEAEVDPEFHGCVQTIFAELVSNAFDHGCKDLEEGFIKLRLELNNAFFSLEVTDPGPGFDAKATLERIRKEPLLRHRRRGLLQVDAMADDITYSPEGNHIKAIVYRKRKGSGIATYERDGITYVAVKGKGDLALVEVFKRWVKEYDTTTLKRVCLMLHMAWVSSLFVGAIIELHSRLTHTGSDLSIWVEHESCYNNMNMLGITGLIPTSTSREDAVRALSSLSEGE